MTKFLTYYNLFPIPDPKEFMGIAEDKEHGNVLATISRNIVVILNISTQKQMNSWSVLEKFSCKVIYDRRSEKYVGVFANLAVRLWDETTKDLNKVKKLKFQKSIADLINNGDETMVLYSDGSCETLASALESRKDQQEAQPVQIALAASQTIINAAIHTLSNGEKMLTYFLKNNKMEDLHLMCISLSDGELKIVPIQREYAQIVGYAIVDGERSPILMTIWSDKRIFTLNLEDDIESAPGNFVSMLTELNIAQNICLLGISRNFVAIYGANIGQEGSSLILYNIQFKVVKAKQFFKIYLDFSRLWATNEHILLALGQYISVVTYRISKDLLADLLGTQNQDENLNIVGLDHINEEEHLEEGLSYVPNETSLPAIKTKEKISKNTVQLIEADGKTVPFESIDEFDQELSALSKFNLETEVVEVDEAFEETQLLLMSNHSDEGSKSNAIGAVQRQMERCGYSEQEISEKLLNVLIAADQPEQILSCIRRYTNISERMIARTLGYAINKTLSSPKQTKPKIDNEKQLQQISDADASDSAVPVPKTEYPILDLLAPRHKPVSNDLLETVLALSFDPNGITQHIRQEIDYKGVIFLMQYIYEKLTDDSDINIECLSYDPECVRFEMQSLRWFGVLMCSHFQELAISKDEKLLDIFTKWQELLHAYRCDLSELEHVGALLYNIVHKRQIKQESSYSKWYSVDEVLL